MKIQLKNWQRLALLIIVGLFVTGIGASFESPTIFRVGVLNPDKPLEPVFDGFKAALSGLGYTEGEDIEYLYAGPTGKNRLNLHDEAQALKDAQVDLVLAIASPGALAAKEVLEGSDIPVIFWVLSDPLEDKLILDMQRPGTNMTGLTIGVEGIASEGRRLELLKQMVPGIQRVFIPYDPNHSALVGQALPTIQGTADSLGIELILQAVQGPEAVRSSAENIPDDVDAVYIIHLDRMVMQDHRAFIDNALERHLPLSLFTSNGVEHGAFMSFGTQYYSIGEQAARMAEHILQGAEAAETPVEIPEFFLSVNLQTAETIGLEIPDSIIRQADLVVR